MKKIFCDCCGKEFEHRNTSINAEERRVCIGSVSVKVRVQVTPYHCHGSGSGQHIDLCDNCGWLAVDKLDPRTKAVPVTPLTDAASPDYTADRFPGPPRDNY